MDREELIFAALNIANDAPKRIPPRNDSELPMRATSSTESDDPNRTKLRRDKEEAKLAMLWTDKE